MLRLYYMRQNVLKRRAHRAAKRGTPEDGGVAPHADDEGDADVVNEHKNAFLDLTDRKNRAPPLLLRFAATAARRLTPPDPSPALCAPTDELIYAY